MPEQDSHQHEQGCPRGYSARWPGKVEACTCGAVDRANGAGRRIPIVRRDADGSVVDGTVLASTDGRRVKLSDWRDLDGAELPLPAGSAYEVAGQIAADNAPPSED